MATSPVETKRATIDDLMHVDGKAELIDGRIVELMPTGDYPNVVAGEIFVQIRAYAKATRRGVAHTDNATFAVPELSSGRESFSPDASYYTGPRDPDRMGAIPGPPTLAVEVRSKGDYGPKAEREIVAKRADYFEAGTLVVWDVDVDAEVVRSFRRDAPDSPRTFGRGEVAEAEPALPGWRVAVDDLFA